MLHASKHLLLILSLAVILTHGRLLSAENQDDYYRNYEELVKVVRLIKDKYVDDVELAQLLTGAYRGMLQELDPYSQYIGPDEMEDLRIETEGEFGGLGIEVIVQDGILTVITPILDSPAFRAGIMPGDRIIKIEDESAERITLREAVKKLRGKPGTEVTITVLHLGETEPADVTIERDIVRLTSVRGAKILDAENKIGYVSITSFQEDTVEELDEAIEGLLQEEMAALILDMRFNPGGLLDTAVGVSDRFLEENVIVTTKGKDLSQNQVYHAKKPDTFPDFPLVVLVNNGSASAAEIVAGAIRDNKRGILVGTTTFGKGSVQSLVPVEEGLSAIKLTTAKYYTPSGKLIHEIGIEPDVVVELDKEETKALHRYLSKSNNTNGTPDSDSDELSLEELEELEEDAFADIQLQRALDILRGDQRLFTKILDNPTL